MPFTHPLHDPMSKLLQTVLTDRDARDASAMDAYAAKLAVVGSPWS
jgi:hypothetical protein